MPIERIEITSRDQWMALRKQDVTASRVGALFGLHPYVTAARLYYEQSGIEFPEIEESPVMRRGRLLEGAVALAVEDERPDWNIIKGRYYYRDTELRLGATPDFLIEGDPRGLGVLQTKTAAPSVFEKQWSGGTEIPFWITLQTLTECMLTGAAFGVVAAMRVDPFNLLCPILDIPRHETSEQRIRAAVKQFWRDVAQGNEPTIDYGRDKALIQVLTPREVKDKTVDLSGDNELPALLDQRSRLHEMIKTYQDRCEEIDSEIRWKMRDAERVVGLDGWSITYKSQLRKEFVVKAKSIRTLRVHDKRKPEDMP
jgi:predicted phage-related endonuclease